MIASVILSGGPSAPYNSSGAELQEIGGATRVFKLWPGAGPISVRLPDIRARRDRDFRPLQIRAEPPHSGGVVGQLNPAL